MPRRLSIVAAPLGHDIDPYRDQERGVDELAWLYADGLVGIGARPLLAASAPVARNGGTTYRYTLRAARWHDGKLVTARDVEAALSAVLQGYWGTYEPYRFVRRLDVLDAQTFDVHLSAPTRRFVRTFFGASGVPALPLIRHDGGDLPIGTGPYAVVRRPDSDTWFLQARSTSPRGVPAISELSVRMITFDSTRSIEMASREAFIALPLPPDAVAGPYTTVTRRTSAAAIVFNMEGPFGTVEARRACARFADVPKLQSLYGRHAVRSIYASLLMTGPGDEAWKAALAPIDPAHSGLRDAIGQHVLRLAYATGSRSHERVMLPLQDRLNHAGIRSEFRRQISMRYTGADGPLRTGDFDLAVNGYAYVDADDLAADWSCAALPPRGGNFARWCDAETDRLLSRRDLGLALRHLYDRMVCLPLGISSERIGISTALAGVALPEMLAPFTYDCVRWRWAAPGTGR